MDQMLFYLPSHILSYILPNNSKQHTNLTYFMPLKANIAWPRLCSTSKWAGGKCVWNAHVCVCWSLVCQVLCLCPWLQTVLRFAAGGLGQIGRHDHAQALMQCCPLSTFFISPDVSVIMLQKWNFAWYCFCTCFFCFCFFSNFFFQFLFFPPGTWRWINVVSMLVTLNQHWNNIDPTSCAQWVASGEPMGPKGHFGEGPVAPVKY